MQADKLISTKPVLNQEPQLFTNNGWQIRTVVHEGQTWFIAKDIAECLQYKNTRDAIKSHCKFNITVAIHDGKKGNPNITIIPESDCYRMAMRSKMPEAVKFEEWVMDDVLPQISRTGHYTLNNAPSLPDFTNPAEAARAWANEFESKLIAETKLIEQAPKVEFAEQIEGSKDCITIGEYAKIHGGIGRNKLFAMLRDHKVLMKNNVPYQRFIVQEYFEVTEKPTSAGIKTVTLVTGKGQSYLQKKLTKWL